VSAAGASQDAAGASGNSTFAALRVRDFRRFWLAAFASNTGGWMQNATVPYVVFTVSNSPGDVGVAGFFQYVPFMLMGAVGGTLADRLPRRQTLMATQFAQALCAVALYVVVASGSATTASVSALAFLSGLAGGVNTPIWQAFVSDLVPRELLMNAVTLNSAQFNASRALGPFLAGVVIALAGPSAAFAINAASFAAVVGVLVVIRGRPAARREGRVGVLGGLTAAVRHVRSSPAILACCTAIIVVAGIGSPLFSYLAVYGERVFGVQGALLGLLFGAGGIGSVLFTPLLLRAAPRLPRAVLLAGSMLLYGASVMATGLAPTYAWAVVALLFHGGAYLTIASTINTTIQLIVREELRGTVIALYLMCLTGSLPLGLFVWGVFSERLGVRSTTVGAGALLVMVTWALVAAGRFKVMAAADVARDDAVGPPSA
jgi:MFS family permease